MYLSVVKNLEKHVSLGSSIFQNLLNCYSLWLYIVQVNSNFLIRYFNSMIFRIFSLILHLYIYIIFSYKGQQIKSYTFFFKSKQKLFFAKFNIVKIAFKTIIESSQERKYQRTIKK